MGFERIRDQAVAVRLLRNIIRRRRVPHGLLFYGPAGVGKHTTARELAKAINCAAGGGDPCGACLPCRKVDTGNHPDVKTIAPSGKTRIINVDTVEFINELAAYRPFEGRSRVLIIEDVDRMREEAQNHFLKTLEEPPSNTLFILITEFPRRLLPTVRSRCQPVRFGALRRETVSELLLRDFPELPPGVAPAVAAIAQGQMSRARNLVESGKRDLVLDMTHRLALGEDPLKLSGEFTAQLKAAGEALRAQLKAEFDEAEPDDGTREDREEAKAAQDALIGALIRRELMEYLYLIETWYRDALVFGATQDAARVLNCDQTGRLGSERSAENGAKIAAAENAWVQIERNLNMDRVFRDLFFALAP